MKYIYKFLLFFLLISFTCLSLIAGTTGKITGTVVDAETGEPLPGTNIILEGTTIGAATDINGSFFILNVPPGKYNVVVSMIGYKSQRMEDVLVQVDLTTTLNFELSTEVIDLGESITVIAERPPVQVDLTSSEARISSDNIKVMPVTEMRDILELQSGITVDAGGGLHIRGGRSSEIAYWIDGVPVTDVYDGNQSVIVENSSIQELQVVSGTFNAEYGNAMSGIINIVTKEGSRNFTGFISTYGGDYFSNRDKLFRGINEINPLSERDLQASLSGPIPLLENYANFYLSARYNYTDGWLYGINHFNMYGDTLSGDKYTPMNWREKITTHGKLTIRPMSRLKLHINFMTSNEDYADFDHGLQYVPEANIEKHNQGRNLSIGLTHTLSNRTFYEFNYSQFYKYFWMRKFEDENDPRYIDPYYWVHIERVNPWYWFTDHAINTTRFWRRTDTQVAKFDFTSQITDANMIKFGIEGKLHKLELDDYSIIDDPYAKDTVFTPYFPSKTEASRRYYLEQPREFSTYLQDKIEFKSVIVNIGIRWDYFDANSKVPANPKEPNIYNPIDPLLDSLSLEEREEFWWKEAEPKSQISPRLGIAYPITDRGVIHFSFGHFFQIPSFNLLYDNPGYKIPETSGVFGVFRNPDLKPQKTVMYEIGLKQELIRGLTIDLTSFYRDVRDWVSTGTQIDLGGGVSYVIFENKDYSNVRGVVLSIEKRYSNYNWFNIYYTYQVAEGSNSYPSEAFQAIEQKREPRKYIIPLDWDQSHSLNFSTFIGTENWGTTLIGRYGSGYPYTPEVTVASRMGRNLKTGLETNSRRKPATYEFDIKLFRKFSLGGLELTAFLNIYNFLDTENQINVWGNTGRADKNLDEPDTPEQISWYESAYRINTINEYFTHPEWYSAPRKIHFGFDISW
jgi:outer membrane receptor for ferrienterochelin and colicin